jgi:hypothetical protein
VYNVPGRPCIYIWGVHVPGIRSGITEGGLCGLIRRMPNHASILSAHALYVVSQCVCVVIAPVSDRVRPVAELSLTGADTVRRLGHLTEKSQFETEKSQFETEKSQFDTVGLLLSARNNLRSALCSAIHFCIQ